MFQRYIRYISLVALSILNISCIFDDISECPVTEYEAEISVKDINYENIGKFPDVKVNNQDMPFHSFAKTIYYALSNMSGKHIKESTVLYTGGDSPTFHISFRDIPQGEYILTVWGNISENYPAGALHPEGQEYTDIYTCNRTIRFDSEHKTAKLALERTKGLLLLSCSGLPDKIVWIKMNISGTYSSVDADLNYAGNVNVEKTMPFQPVSTTLLSPSANGPSVLRLSFYTDNPATSEPFIKLPDINLYVSRNQISPVAVDYDDEAGMYEIRMFINDRWVMIHRLFIK